MALNEEAEKAAFKAWFDSHTKDWPFQHPAILQLAAEGYWDVWLAAKEDAIEEAKPKVAIVQNGKYWWILCKGVMVGCYTTSEEAENAAEDYNMKVVSVTGFDHGETQ